MNNQTKTTKPKKINTGKIGFILSLIILLPLCLSFSPSLTLLLLLISPILCLLTLISLIFSIHGLIKQRNRKPATISLIINAFIIVILFFLFITLTPPGSMPYPLNIYKFKRACPKATFWLDFDRGHIKRVQSQNVFFNNVGTVHFASSPNAYTLQQVIQFAEENGWKCHVSIPASKFQALLNTNEDELSIEEYIFRYEITSIEPLSFLMEQNDSVLIFETENYLGVPSLAVLAEKRDELRVYNNNPARPDPASDFSMPQSIYNLNENNNEDIY